MPKYIKPTLKTKFHIDFDWWMQSDRNFRQVLMSHLCDECRASVEADSEIRLMDWVDPETAQVFKIDQLWHVVQTQCSHKANFLAPELPLITAVFRLFLKNDNQPLTPAEIHQQLHRKSSQLILRAIGGRTVYQGIRPVAPLI